MTIPSSSSNRMKGKMKSPLRTLSFLLVHSLLLTQCFADQSKDSSTLVKKGVKDCTDEGGGFNPSKCAIKNRTSEDIRFKRAAIPDPENKDATTAFFTNDRGRTRPVGLLSTSLGAFVTSGTTTEYLTKVLGTYIKGTYARIVSTQSKIYHAVPSEEGGAVRPTGFIASTISNEVNGYATTVHTTDFYRTYIDGTYAQIVSSSSEVKYPSWYYTSAIADLIQPTAATGNEVYPTVLPKEIRGSFEKPGKAQVVAEVGVVAESDNDSGNILALKPHRNLGKELKVTGTHGKFVHQDKAKGEETTYNVFTGQYVQNSKTFLFFFGNTVIDPTKSGMVKPTLMVENGDSGENMKVSMTDKIKVVVPASNSRVRVAGSIGGKEMPGVLVEIEGSEPQDISVNGATEMGTPQIDTITMAVGEETSVSSSSSRSDENEVPTARKVQDIQASRVAKTPSLPTFTVGQPDMDYMSSSQNPIVVLEEDMMVESSTKSNARAGAPVFFKTTEKPPPPKSTHRIQALGYTQKKSSSGFSNANLNGKYPMQLQPNRSHKAFAMFDTATKANDVDGDLSGAASTGRATVTYVGFADFTTTVGNTVIVFMPRTKMIEDLSVHASKTQEQVEPTKYVYHTGDTTTEEYPDEHIQFSVSQVKQGKSPKKVSFRDEDDEAVTEINPTEASVSGRETILLGKSSIQKPKVKGSSSSIRSSLFSTPRPKFTPKVSSASSPVYKKPGASVYQTASTKVFQTEILNPTGLVTSIDGTLVKDGKTTLYTSLVFGTFIGKSYAQVIKSSSKILTGEASISPSAKISSIRPTSVAKLPSSRGSKSRAPVYYEFSTTTQSGDDDEVETTTYRNRDVTTEVSVSTSSSTTEKASTTEAEPEITTLGSVDLEGSYDDEYLTTTTERELENEVGQKRKVAGNARDQTIRDLEPSQEDGEEQTVYVTRTLPTTVYKTLTYFTTFYIPDEDGVSTKTSINSREVTSSAVGLVRKTFTSIIPSESSDVEPAVKPSEEVKRRKPFRGRPNTNQVIYKTLYTTYTYLTSYFSGSTSSVSSREETVSNVITVTSEIGKSSATTITPTSTSNSRSRGYKTVSPRLSTASQGGHTNVGSSSPGASSRSGVRASTILRSRGSASRQASSSSSSPVPEGEDVDDRATDEIEYQSVTRTLLRTFMTTYTYFTTLFNGDDTSIKSRTEVITNVVPYLTKTLSPIVPTSSPNSSPSKIADADAEEYEEEVEVTQSSKIPSINKSKAKETTFFTTYTFLSTIYSGKSSTIKTSKQTYTNIVIGDSTIRSGYVEPIKPTVLSGRAVGEAKSTRTPKFQSVKSNSVEDKEEDLTTYRPHPEYELEGSEDVGVTTNRPESYDDEEDNDVPTNEKTPLLKTLFTTFTFYTTYFKGGSSTVSSRLETKSQIVTDNVDLEDVTVTDKAPLLSSIDPALDPVTYYTTYTFWTTHLKDRSSVVTSRESTVTNVVTPGLDSISPSASDISVKETDNNEILPTSTPEIELTTFFTTYTYFTTSYLPSSHGGDTGDNTIINSRLETVTNIITGTVNPTPTQTGRAIGTVKPGEQKLGSNEKDEYEDYATGLISTIRSSTVRDGTTTLFNTDIYGSLIDGIYAQVLESTSTVIQPTAAAFTRFFPEATETVTGVVSVNEGKTVEGGKGRTTYYATTAYGTVIDNQYAHLIERSSSVKVDPSKSLEPSGDDYAVQKTGLVRVIDGTLVEGDHTTFYTSSIIGTFVDGQYAQVIESTSRFVISPTKAVDEPGASKTVVVDVESSVTESSGSDEDVSTTTEKQEEETNSRLRPGIRVPPRRFGGGRDRSSSRLSFTNSKSVTPTITPFASRSRPSGFSPRSRRPSSSIIPSKTEEASSPSSSSSTTTNARGSFQPKRRFQKPAGDSSSDGPATPTPALPASRSRGTGKFTKPSVVTKPSAISPSSVSGSTGGSSPGARGRSSFAPRGSARSPINRPSISSAGARGGASSSTSRFIPGRGRASSINPSPSASAVVEPTQIVELNPDQDDEYETVQSSTEAPKSGRYAGPNRFRLSNKLSTPAAASARTTTSRPATTRGSPLNLRRFSKPTIATRGTTPSPSSSSATEEYYDDSPSPKTTETEQVSTQEENVSSTTQKTLKPGFGSRKPIIRPTSRPVAASPPARSRQQSSATTPAPTTTTTTKRTYTPRPRPASFPKAVRTTTTTAAPLADDEYYEEGEFEYQESKHVPNPNVNANNATISAVPDTSVIPESPAAAASEISEQRVEPPPNFKFLDNLFEGNSDLLDSILKSIPDEDSSTRRKKRSTATVSRQVSPKEYAYLISSINNYPYGARTARNTLRSNFPSRSSNLNSKPNSRFSGQNADYEYVYEYEDDDQPIAQPPPPPPPPPTTPAPSRQSPSARFRGRIQPTPASTTSTNRRTPFTLTPNSNSNSNSNYNTASNTRTPSPPTRSRGSTTFHRPTVTSISNSNANSSPSRPFIPTRGRTQSRYQQRATEPPTTTSRTISSRFRNRYNSRDSVTTAAPSRTRFGSSLTRGRGSLSSPNKPLANNDAPFESSSITVTHYVPAETHINFVNGKSTETKTIITQSPSIQILSPFQYTESEYLGKPVLVINSESTAMPSIGITEITRFVIRESLTTSVVFTPTSIRGRKTSFSHIVPSTVYSVEPVVSTISNPVSPLQDPNQLTNLLLNQLLGQGLLNPANLLALQQGQGSLLSNPEPATPYTNYNTKTTSYVTTLTDLQSTIVRLTLHGKLLKSTIVESKTNVITATEFITESTVITPSAVQTHQQLNTLPQIPSQNNLLLQNLLQLQQQQLLQQSPIVATPAPQLSLQLQTQSIPSPSEKKDNQEEESVQKLNSKVPDPPKPSASASPAKPASSVVTLYVSGKNPGEFSTILQTVSVSESREKRSVAPTTTLQTSLELESASVSNHDDMTSYFDDGLHFSYNPTLSLSDNHIVQLEDSYSYSDPISMITNTLSSKNGDRATDSLESVLGDSILKSSASFIS